MSDPVKLASALPKHEALNGLAEVRRMAVKRPETTRITAVVVLDVSKLERNMDTGEEVPTFRVRRIEPIVDPEYRTQVAGLAVKQHEFRTGSTTLPLDLDDDERVSFE